MSYENAEVLRDKNGNPIPQLYDPVLGKFVPQTNEPVPTQLTGSIMETKTVNRSGLLARSSHEDVLVAEGKEIIIHYLQFEFENVETSTLRAVFYENRYLVSSESTNDSIRANTGDVPDGFIIKRDVGKRYILTVPNLRINNFRMRIQNSATDTDYHIGVSMA